MKRISIIVIVAIVCSLLSVLIIKNINHKTHETSYEFTKEQIENRILINEITNSINENYLLKTFSKDDAKEQINEQYKPIKQSEVVKELTIAKLRKSILASKNVVLDYDLAKETTNQEFDRLKSDETTENYYQSVKVVLSEYSISEKEYLQLLYDYSYDLYVENIFKNWFAKDSNLYKKPDNSDLIYIDKYPDLDSQIELYLEKELKKITIAIK